MNPLDIAKALVAVLTPLAALLGLTGRRRRLRAEIRADLALVSELEGSEALRSTPVVQWLQGRIALDVARLAGVPLGTAKKPIPWSSVITEAILGTIFGGWTWLIDRDGFVWYSVFRGVVAGLMGVAILGAFSNRQVPPETEAVGAAQADSGVAARSSDPSTGGS